MNLFKVQLYLHGTTPCFASVFLVVPVTYVSTTCATTGVSTTYVGRGSWSWSSEYRSTELKLSRDLVKMLLLSLDYVATSNSPIIGPAIGHAPSS